MKKSLSSLVVLAGLWGFAQAAEIPPLSFSEWSASVGDAKITTYNMSESETHVYDPLNGLIVFGDDEMGEDQLVIRIPFNESNGETNTCNNNTPCVGLTTVDTSRDVLNLDGLDRPGPGDDSRPNSVTLDFNDPDNSTETRIGAVFLSFRNVDASDNDSDTRNDVLVELYNLPTVIDTSVDASYRLDDDAVGTSFGVVSPNDLGFGGLELSLIGGGGANLLSVSFVMLDDYLAAIADDPMDPVDPPDPIPVPGAFILFGSVAALSARRLKRAGH